MISVAGGGSFVRSLPVPWRGGAVPSLAFLTPTPNFFFMKNPFQTVSTLLRRRPGRWLLLVLALLLAGSTAQAQAPCPIAVARRPASGLTG